MAAELRQVEQLLVLERRMGHFGSALREQMFEAERLLQRRLREFEQLIDEDLHRASRMTSDSDRARVERTRERTQRLRGELRRLEPLIARFRTALREAEELSRRATPQACRFLQDAHDRARDYMTLPTDASVSTSLTPLGGGSSAQTIPAPVVPTPSSSEGWRDHGVVWVSVADLPDPEGIHGAEDFEKVSLDDMRTGLARLQEMRPDLEQGAGRNHWSERDQVEGLASHQGYQNMYEVFFGDSAIRVERDGGTYDIINGRHRIFVAKQMGLDKIPVRLSERGDFCNPGGHVGQTGTGQDSELGVRDEAQVGVKQRLVVAEVKNGGDIGGHIGQVAVELELESRVYAEAQVKSEPRWVVNEDEVTVGVDFEAVAEAGASLKPVVRAGTAAGSFLELTGGDGIGVGKSAALGVLFSRNKRDATTEIGLRLGLGPTAAVRVKLADADLDTALKAASPLFYALGVGEMLKRRKL